MTILCNEEGLWKRLPVNCIIDGLKFVGDIMFVGRKRGKFSDVTYTEDKFRERFPELF